MELSQETRSALGGLIGELKPGLGRVTWVRPERMHLTVKFLGEIDEGLVDRIDEKLKRICGEAQPFGFDIAGIGCFPNPSRPRVIWAGIEGDIEPARELQRRIDTELEHLGFEHDARGFSPHVTLGRVKGSINRGALHAAIESNREREFGSDRIEEVILMRSKLLPEGPQYTPLARFDIGKGMRISSNIRQQ